MSKSKCNLCGEESEGKICPECDRMIEIARGLRPENKGKAINHLTKDLGVKNV